MSKKVRIVGKIRNSFRSDTLSKWETNNPILLEGEIGVVIGLNEVGDGLEDETKKIKIGDGIHTWKELSWFSIGGTSTLDIDQTYNPESTNAQSGVALAPIFQKKLELWQPNTKYKVGDTVIAFHSPGMPSGMPSVNITFIVKCKTPHISSSEFGSDLNTLDIWDVNSIEAYQALYAVYDRNGKSIDLTYATKDELTSAIGEALEGDY